MTSATSDGDCHGRELFRGVRPRRQLSTKTVLTVVVRSTGSLHSNGPPSYLVSARQMG